MNKSSRHKIAIIGAGIGGMATAASLAAAGFAVDIYEKNNRAGGRLNVLKTGGFTFDLGPSMLILPQMFRALFERTGRNMDGYVSLVELKPHGRHFFDDSIAFDLTPDVRLMENELEKLGDAENGFYSFLEHSREQFRLIEKGYFRKGYDTLSALIRGYGVVSSLFEADVYRGMAHAVEDFVTSDRMTTALGQYALQMGSSPHNAPAVLSLLPYANFGYGLWYVRGGMHNLAQGLERLLDELGVCVHLNSEVVSLPARSGRVRGIVLAGGQSPDYDAVVSNMDVRPAYERLLHESEPFLEKFDRFEPSCSGLVLHLGLDRKYPQLAHHNFFHAVDPTDSFDRVFNRHELPDDPTVHVAAPTVTDPTRAPADCENLTVLIPVPHLRIGRPVTEADYFALKERAIKKLERCGLTDLRKHILAEDVWTPYDFERAYYADRGALYGVAADAARNRGLRFPKQSGKYDNLYFAGASVNPGGNLPLSCLTGMLTADRVIAALRRNEEVPV